MKNKHDVFALEELASFRPFFGTVLGRWVAKRLFDLLAITKTNKANAYAQSATPWEGANKLMDYFKIKVQVENEEILAQLKEGAFITVSNHAYGAIDGICLTGLMGRYRPDFKMMVNDVLLRISSISAAFIGVKPQIGFKKAQTASSQGLKEVLSTIRGGHPLCLFPAGAVSMYGGNKFLSDREWQESALKLIKAADVPVVPIFFHGYNSKFFYFLEHIHISLRSFLMAREAFNKPNYVLKLTIGTPISVEEQSACGDLAELGVLLRNRTYQLSGDKRLYTPV